MKQDLLRRRLEGRAAAPRVAPLRARLLPPFAAEPFLVLLRVLAFVSSALSSSFVEFEPWLTSDGLPPRLPEAGMLF